MPIDDEAKRLLARFQDVVIQARAEGASNRDITDCLRAFMVWWFVDD